MTDPVQAAPVNDGDILRQAADWRRMGRGVAMATVVETFGSAPRPAGARVAVEESGLFCGSVPAGCVEGEVIVATPESSCFYVGAPGSRATHIAAVSPAEIAASILAELILARGQKPLRGGAPA